MFSLFQKLSRFVTSLFGFHMGPTYRIVEVNQTTQQIAFQLKGKAIIVRCTFAEAIANHAVINGLLPTDACWIGGYYGRAMRASMEGRQALRTAKNMTFLLKNNFGRYKIIFQNRDGEIGYIDNKTKQEFIEHPLTLVTNEYIVNHFDPSQACYLGILAGISMEKGLSSDKHSQDLDRLLQQRPKLRIVK